MKCYVTLDYAMNTAFYKIWLTVKKVKLKLQQPNNFSGGKIFFNSSVQGVLHEPPQFHRDRIQRETYQGTDPKSNEELTIIPASK